MLVKTETLDILMKPYIYLLRIIIANGVEYCVAAPKQSCLMNLCMSDDRYVMYVCSIYALYVRVGGLTTICVVFDRTFITTIN